MEGAHPNEAGPGPAPAEASLGRLLALAFALAFGLGLVTLDGAFVYDDKFAIVRNPVVNGAAPASEAFARDFWGTRLGHEDSHTFRPLLPLLWRGMWALFPEQPLPFRVLSAASHMLALLALVVLLRRLDLPPREQGAAALIFACHATHAEALGSMVAQADVLSAALGLGAIAMSLRARRPSGGLLVGAVFLVASLVKESTFIFAGAGMAVMALRPGSSVRERLLLLAPTAVVTTALIIGQLVLLRFLLQRAGDTGYSNSIAYDAHGLEGLLLGLSFIARGSVVSLMPVGLGPDHGYAAWDLSLGTLLPHAIPGLLLSLLLGLSGVAALHSRRPQWIVAAALFSGPVLLNSGLIVQVPDELPERTFYPATMGAAIGYAAALQVLRRRSARAGTLALGLLVVFMTAQHVRVQRPWHSEASLWEFALQVEPKSEKMQMITGYHHRDEGRQEHAAYHFAVTAYIATARPDPVDFGLVRELDRLPIEQRWLAAPVLLNRHDPCRFVLGLLVIYRERMPDFEAKAFVGYRERYPVCFEAAAPGAR